MVQVNQLSVPYSALLNYVSSFDEVDSELDKIPAEKLGHLLWSTDGYKPEVSFAMAHCTDTMFLKYIVKEDYIRMLYNNINDQVYKDSCVEFFIALNGGDHYYNLEFNCAATCCAGYGSGKHGRVAIDVETIKTIRSKTQIQTVNGRYHWTITLIIPATVFTHHKNIDLNGLTGRGNFYKCGDDLPQPHFVAWNNIEAVNPDFHVPEFFGNILFLTH